MESSSLSFLARGAAPRDGLYAAIAGTSSSSYGGFRAPQQRPETVPAGTDRWPQAIQPEGLSLLRVLDEIDYGLMLVTDNAKVCFANHVALRECSAGFPMRLQDGRVQPRTEREVEPFLKALAAARHGRRSMLSLQSQEAAVSLAVVPMAGLADIAGAPTTLLVFGKRQVCEPLSVELYAQTHHLTNAERSVLRGLCRGLRPGQIAAETGVAVSTVRTQIRNIRVKTGTTSIAELVRRVTVLPPIVPALDKMSWSQQSELRAA